MAEKKEGDGLIHVPTILYPDKGGKGISVSSSYVDGVQITRNERKRVVYSQVRQWILEGVPKYKIIDRLINDKLLLGYKYSNKRATLIYYDVRGEMKGELQSQKEDIREDLYLKLQNLYCINYAKEDYKEARECLKDLAKMAGLSNAESSIMFDKQNDIVEIKFGFNNDE